MNPIGIRNKRFLVLGRAGMDFYAEPAGVILEEAEKFAPALGGSAANIAVGLVKLGCTASLVTCVSDDAVGRYVLRQLEGYGVDASHVGKAQAYYRNSLAVIEQRADNCQNVIYRSNAADLEMSREQVAAIDFSQFGALVITGTALSAEPSRTACLAALEAAKAAGIPAMIDIDYRANAWRNRESARATCLPVAERCSVVVANDEEFEVLAGGMAEGLALARRLGAANDRFVVYKMGEKGSIAFSGGTESRQGIFRVKALKPTGAGDAFMAGLLASIADGYSVADAISRGSAAAAIVVSRFGCAPAEPTMAELETFLRRRQPEMA